MYEGNAGRPPPSHADFNQQHGRTAEEMGELQWARPMYEEALRVSRETLGCHHHYPDTLNSISNMAALLQGMGELQEARELYEEAL